MRNILVIISIFFLFPYASAPLFPKEKIINNENFDKDKLSWGYYLGFSSYDFNFDYIKDKPDILVKRNAGFNVGLVSTFRINEFIDLRFEPGLNITSRDLYFNESYFDGTSFSSSDLIREVKSTYIHLPLLIKFSTKRLDNFKPFIVGGFSTALNLSSNEKNPDDNDNGQFRTKSNMFFYELGFGIDFYLYWFKFTPTIRGVFAINDELIRDEDPNSPWTGNISTMKTRGVFINFTFQ